MEKRVLFLQPDRLTCYRLEKGSAVVDRHWPIEGDLMPKTVSLYLEEFNHAEFSLLFDLPEEECHLEALKTLNRSDQKHLIERLKNKRFENALLSKSNVAGKPGTMSLMLSVVATHAVCASLLDLLAKAECCVRSVHSPVSLISAVSKITASTAGSRLYVIPLPGCYRLIACQDSSVLFNRRIPANPVLELNATENGGEPNVSALNAVDITRSLTETLVYLQRLGQHAWKTPELVYVATQLTPNAVKDAMDSVVESGLAHAVRDVGSVSGNAHSRGFSARSFLIGSAFHCGNGYATKEHRSAYTARKVRNVCAALLLCGVTGAISSYAIANKLTGQHELLIQSYDHSSSTSAGSTLEIDTDYEYPVEAVRQALATARLLEMESQHTPMRFLTGLAENVQQLPAVSVTTVQWEVEDAVDGNVLRRLFEHPDATQAEVTKKLHLEQVYRATVSGVVQGRPDAALNTFEAFVSALRSANSDPSVIVVETPFGLGAQSKTTAGFENTNGGFVLEFSGGGLK